MLRARLVGKRGSAPVSGAPLDAVRRWAALFTLAVVMLLTLSSASAVQRARGLDPAVIRTAVESVVVVVEREYFDARVAARVAGSLRQNLAQGRYDSARDLKSLAEALTSDLFGATRDKHLVVQVSRDAAAAESAAAAEETRAVRGRRSNFGVQRVEILAGNVGYLNLTSFYRPDEARTALAAAMRLLSGADALILDMRQNGGGSPDTVTLLLGHLFEAPGLPLFEIVSRSGSRSLYATPDPAVTDRDGRRPVSVLTSKATFSAGEGVAFILQERRRAEIVGERTPGAANSGRPYPAGAGLEVTVPNGYVRSLISGTNWEGTGVTPDVAVAADDALRVAHVRCIRKLLETVENGAWRDTLERTLQSLERSGGH